MAASFTPGPWQIQRQGELARIFGGPDGQFIARVEGASAEDANVLGAASELLEALIAFRDGGPQGGHDFAQWHKSYAPAIEKARAAIAKAMTGSA